MKQFFVDSSTTISEKIYIFPRKCLVDPFKYCNISYRNIEMNVIEIRFSERARKTSASHQFSSILKVPNQKCTPNVKEIQESCLGSSLYLSRLPWGGDFVCPSKMSSLADVKALSAK